VRRRFEAVRNATGMPWLRFKDLRHVFASHSVQTGGALKDLGRTLGHAVDSTPQAVARAAFRVRSVGTARFRSLSTEAGGGRRKQRWFKGLSEIGSD